MCCWFVYVVRCADDTLYTGTATDVTARVRKHNAGKGARYTRSRRPVRLVWFAAVRGGRGPALRREAAIKRLSRKKKLALIGNFARKE